MLKLPCRLPGRCARKPTGYVLHTDVDEVVLNASVLENDRLSWT